MVLARLISVLRCGLVLQAALALTWAPARAEDAATFLTESARIRAALVRLDADPARADEMYALEAQARADLRGRLLALLGPFDVPGLQPDPAFSPDSLFADTQVTAFGTPDGLLFTDADDTTRLFVTPEPVLADWLRRAASLKGAPPAFARGPVAAMATEQVAGSVLQGFEAFVPFRPLPVPAQSGETLLALYGYAGPDTGPHHVPNAILLARLAEGRFMAGLAFLSGQDLPDTTPCDGAYDQRLARVRDDAARLLWPSAADAAQLEASRMAAEDAFQACIATDAPRQPAFGKVLARATGLLATMRAGRKAP